MFTGLALARTAQGGGVATVGGVIVIGKLATVNIGWDVFHENWGFKLAPSTILMHLKTKDDKRIEEAHRWARHCELRVTRLACKVYVGCNGAKRNRCSARYPEGRASPSANCSTVRADLKNDAGADPTSSDPASRTGGAKRSSSGSRKQRF